MHITRTRSRRYFRALLAFSVLLIISPFARAIVNMENIHLGEPPPGFSGNVTFNLNGASGNSERFRVGAGTRLQRYTDGVLRYLAFDYAYGESFSRRDQNRTFLHGRRIDNINDIFDWELFTQLESDEFARLAVRVLLGGGLRSALLEKSADQALYVGVGAFYQIEDVSEGSGATDSGNTESVVGNFYLVFKKKLTSTLTFENTTYVQPKIVDFKSDGTRYVDIKDFRGSNSASLNIALEKNLSLNLSVDVNFDNRPPQKVRTTDTTYTTGIQYSF